MASVPVSISDFPVYDRKNPPEPGDDFSSGAVFLVDKPSGWSSFDVVKFLRSRIKIRKTGHAGTLDPLATGLLVICAGRATKIISTIQEYPKRYYAVVTLGASTPSQDSATDPDAFAPVEHLNAKMINRTLAEQFTGAIQQVPPMYSALRKDGKRLYTYARKGEVVEREPREVRILEIEPVSFEKDHLELDVLCSKGTYVRTLAHDLGLALGSRAYLSKLRRTAIGEYQADKALTVEQIRDIYNPVT